MWCNVHTVPKPAAPPAHFLLAISFQIESEFYLTGSIFGGGCKIFKGFILINMQSIASMPIHCAEHWTNRPFPLTCAIAKNSAMSL